MTKTTALLLTALALASTLANASERGRSGIIEPSITLVQATSSLRAGEPDQASGRVRLCDDKQQCSIATLPAKVGNVNAILSFEIIKRDKTNGSFLTFGKKWVSMCYVAPHEATTVCAPLTRTERLRNFSITAGQPLIAGEIAPKSGQALVFTPPKGVKLNAADYRIAVRSMMRGIHRTGYALAQHATDHYLGRQSLASLTARPSSTGCESNKRVGMICSNGSGQAGRNSLIDDSGEGDGWGGSGGADGDTWPATDWPGDTDPEDAPGPNDGGNSPPPTEPGELPADLPRVIIAGTREPATGGDDGPVVDIPVDMLPWDGTSCIRINRGPVICAGPPPIEIDPDHIVQVPGKKQNFPVKELPILSMERIINVVLDYIESRPKRASGGYGPVYDQEARKCDDIRHAAETAAWEMFNHGWSN